MTEYYLKRTEEASFSSKEDTKKTILFKIKLVKDFQEESDDEKKSNIEESIDDEKE